MRELARHQLAGVPIGVYQAGWSGSTITEWTHAKGNGALYDSKIVPMQPYGIRGVFWYQGESDGSTLHGGSPDDYYVMLPALINEWRSDWGQGNFPFLIVQLPWLDGAAAGWPKVRDGQLTTWLSVTNTGIAVTCDLDLGTDIHPVNKEPIGYRMSLVARGLVYGETSLVYAGPVRDPSQSSIQGNQIIIGFTHIEGGLATSPAGSAPGPFKVAGTDGIYFDATAQIVGNTIVVSSASVPNPVSVRYVWDYSRGNLYNGAGMPASPFEMNLGGGGPTPTPTPGPTATPTPTATPGGSTVMHVADILTTDVNGAPQTVFTKGNTVYWRVKIVDQNNVAVSGASVTTQGLKPNGSNWTTLTATTAADGWALFSKTTNGGSTTGTYTINVTNVTKTGATYNPAANVKGSATFTLQ